MAVPDIVPAVLAKRFDELRETLSRVKGMVPLVQIDVVDGFFSQNRTWPYEDGDSFERIIAGEEGLPFWDQFDFEFDLMISRVEEEIGRFVAAGASRLVLHIESPGVHEALEKVAAARDAGEYAIEVGLALLPTAAPEDLAPFDGQFDFIQVMGIDSVGYQQQPLNPEVYDLLGQVRAAYPNVLVQVDGGANLQTARSLARAGAHRLIVGSAIFGSADPRVAIEALHKEVARG